MEILSKKKLTKRIIEFLNNFAPILFHGMLCKIKIKEQHSV